MHTRSLITPETGQANLTGADPGLRSSPGVTILNSAMPKPAGQGSDARQPAKPATQSPTRSFSSLYCEKFHCLPEKFEEDLLWRCLHPRSLSVARMIWPVYRGYFLPDIHLINEVKDLTGVDEVVSEISGVRHQLPVRGVIRGFLRVRISGQRLVDLANELFKQAE